MARVETVFQYFVLFFLAALGVSGFMRILFSRRVAKDQERMRLPKWIGPMALVGVWGYGLIFIVSHYPVWPLPIMLFFLLASADLTLQARPSNLDSRVLQNRLFGILYLSYIAGLVCWRYILRSHP